MRPRRMMRMATWLGMVIGTCMVGVVCFVFLTEKELGFGASFLLFLGVALLGSAIWKHVEISITKEGVSTKLIRRLEDLQDDVEDIRDEVRELETIVISEGSAVSGLSEDKIKALRAREKRDQLRAQGNFEAALEMDPTDILSLTRLIKRETEQGHYGEVTDLTKALQGLQSRSPLGYSAYPWLILAHEKTGSAATAGELIMKLEGAVSTHVQNGVGYFARAQQLTWLLRDLRKVRKQTSNKSVTKAVEALIRKVEATIEDLAP